MSRNSTYKLAVFSSNVNDGEAVNRFPRSSLKIQNTARLKSTTKHAQFSFRFNFKIFAKNLVKIRKFPSNNLRIVQMKISRLKHKLIGPR